MSDRINIALFGFGRAGKIHFKNLFNNLRVDLKYIVEEYPSVAEKFVLDYRLVNTKIVHSKDIKTVLNDVSLHACVIAAPTKTHESLVFASLEAGKAVFCEKPLANSVEAIGNVYTIIYRIRSLGLHYPRQNILF
jgi:myo-inositol 2-dehydrogenase/D-chiro-inositol 1-dehydrogenase